MQLPIKVGLKHLQGAVWAVCLASAGGALADPQKVTVYTNTDAVDFDPDNATLVLETKVVKRINLPFGGWKDVWGPKCVQNAPAADCTAAMQVWDDVQDAVAVLGDDRLGDDKGVLHAIVMKNAHPDNRRGTYSGTDDSIIVYPSAGPGTTAHEVAHADFDKHHGLGTCRLPCSESAIKKWGVNEGFAKITAHRAAGDGGAWPPTDDNVAAILNGTTCRGQLGTATGASGCAHDLGNLVFEAYEEVVSYVGTVDAYKVYRDALRRLKGLVVTPASLHEKVGQILEERYPRLNIPLPNIPDPFDLRIWDAWWKIFWLGVGLC